MTVKEQAVEAIRELPDDVALDEIIHELAFIGGIQDAIHEIDSGKGLDPDAAKKRLRECPSA